MQMNVFNNKCDEYAPVQQPVDSYVGNTESYKMPLVLQLSIRAMDQLHYGQNFESGKIHNNSIEEHPKISKIAKFGAKCWL